MTKHHRPQNPRRLRIRLRQRITDPSTIGHQALHQSDLLPPEEHFPDRRNVATASEETPVRWRHTPMKNLRRKPCEAQILDRQVRVVRSRSALRLGISRTPGDHKRRSPRARLCGGYLRPREECERTSSAVARPCYAHLFDTQGTTSAKCASLALM